MTKNIEIKQSKKKELILENLRKAPIAQLACERAGVGRATFYRWRKEDKMFAEAVEEALASGASIINDLAESKLIAAIKEGNLTGIIYWLKHRHPAYATRVELSMQRSPKDELTPEQQKMVAHSLALAGIPNVNSLNDTYGKTKSKNGRRKSA